MIGLFCAVFQAARNLPGKKEEKKLLVYLQNSKNEVGCCQCKFVGWSCCVKLCNLSVMLCYVALCYVITRAMHIVSGSVRGDGRMYHDCGLLLS